MTIGNQDYKIINFDFVGLSFALVHRLPRPTSWRGAKNRAQLAGEFDVAKLINLFIVTMFKVSYFFIILIYTFGSNNYGIDEVEFLQS